MWQKYEHRTRISLNSRLKGSAHVWILHVQAHEAIKGYKDDSMEVSMCVQTWTLGLWEAQKYMSVDTRVLESEEANLESLLIFFCLHIGWLSKLLAKALSREISCTYIAEGNSHRARLSLGLGKTPIPPHFFLCPLPTLPHPHPHFFPEAPEIRWSYLIHIAAAHGEEGCLESTCSYSCSESHCQRERLLNRRPFPFPIAVCSCVAKGLGFSLCNEASAHLLHSWGAEAPPGEVARPGWRGRGACYRNLPQDTGHGSHEVWARSGLHHSLGVCPLGWPQHWQTPPLKGRSFLCLVSRNVRWLQGGHQKSLQHLVLWGKARSRQGFMPGAQNPGSKIRYTAVETQYTLGP